jgi:transposase
MDPYSQDLRDRVLRAVERGDRPTDIARRFEVSRLWVYKVKRRVERTGQRASLPIGGYRRSKLAAVEQELRSWIAAKPDLTLEELRQRLAEHGISVKAGAVWHQLDKWNLTFKKNSERQRARASRRATGAPDLA